MEEASGRSLRRADLTARCAAPELEVGVCQYPIMEDVRVRQLEEPHGGHFFRDRRGSLPRARLQHGIEMRVLRPQASFTQHSYPRDGIAGSHRGGATQFGIIYVGRKRSFLFGFVVYDVERMLIARCKRQHGLDCATTCPQPVENFSPLINRSAVHKKATVARGSVAAVGNFVPLMWSDLSRPHI
jgi:hypothetical protein